MSILKFFYANSKFAFLLIFCDFLENSINSAIFLSSRTN